MPVIAAGAIAERRLVERLMRARAFTPDSSQPLANLRWIEDWGLRRLLRKGVIREHAPGRYFLDGPALADRLAFLRLVRAIAVILVILSMWAAISLGGVAVSRIVS